MYLLDTNILIYHLNDSIPKEKSTKVDNIFQTHFNVSVITKMEFLGFGKYTQNTFEKAKKFINYSTNININDDIVNSVISLRRKHNIKLPDAIIAATALINNLTLVTRNESDFKDIDNLKIFNPFK